VDRAATATRSGRLRSLLARAVCAARRRSLGQIQEVPDFADLGHGARLCFELLLDLRPLDFAAELHNVGDTHDTQSRMLFPVPSGPA
jgi:hypothetical protein